MESCFDLGFSPCGLDYIPENSCQRLKLEVADAVYGTVSLRSSRARIRIGSILMRDPNFCRLFLLQRL